jgi:hypothetical protein
VAAVTDEIQLPPIDGEELRGIRRSALAMTGEGPFADRWPNDVMLRLIAEIDRLAYMWQRGGSDDIITGEPASDGHVHTIINGSHGCACSEPWNPPPVESRTLPPES